MRRAVHFVSLLAGLGASAHLGACHRAQLRTTSARCPDTEPAMGGACDTPEGLWCPNNPAMAYTCTCPAERDGGPRAWSCVTAGGPLAPPELIAPTGRSAR